MKSDGSTQKISPVIHIPRNPLLLKGNARTEVNSENGKHKGLKFCNFVAILNICHLATTLELSVNQATFLL